MAPLTSETVLRFLVLVVFAIVSSVAVIYLTLHHATADEVYDFVILGGLRRSRSQPNPKPSRKPKPDPSSSFSPSSSPNPGQAARPAAWWRGGWAVRATQYSCSRLAGRRSARSAAPVQAQAGGPSSTCRSAGCRC
jgi:hypothetical protein